MVLGPFKVTLKGYIYWTRFTIHASRVLRPPQTVRPVGGHVWARGGISHSDYKFGRKHHCEIRSIYVHLSCYLLNTLPPPPMWQLCFLAWDSFFTHLHLQPLTPIFKRQESSRTAIIHFDFSPCSFKERSQKQGQLSQVPWSVLSDATHRLSPISQEQLGQDPSPSSGFS